MLSYQHGYHAGNFADVLKHTTLSRLLAYLLQKDKPLLYLETHSGKGIYDLRDKQALKTNEFREGIKLIWDDKNKLPNPFAEYIKVIKGINDQPSLRFYPGSPTIAINALRAVDRAYFCELHSGEFDHLITIPRLNKKVYFHNVDGIDALKSQLPPIEKRGLIFIDPSYEIKEEYKTIPQAIKQALEKFGHGVYCLWYPVVDRKLKEQLLRRLNQLEAKSTLNIEFHLTTKSIGGMTGCGLWIVNPPYTLAAEMKQVCETLKHYFNPSESSYVIEKHGN